jgi:DSF synthase
MSLLSQRIGLRATEAMLSDGKVYAAPALKAMGIVDEICARGEGQAAVEKFIAAHRQQRPARLMLQRARRRMQPLVLEELHRVVDEWTGIAMALGAPQLRVMEMLARMQRSGVAS